MQGKEGDLPNPFEGLDKDSLWWLEELNSSFSQGPFQDEKIISSINEASDYQSVLDFVSLSGVCAEQKPVVDQELSEKIFLFKVGLVELTDTVNLNACRLAVERSGIINYNWESVYDIAFKKIPRWLVGDKSAQDNPNSFKESAVAVVRDTQFQIKEYPLHNIQQRSACLKALNGEVETTGVCIRAVTPGTTSERYKLILENEKSNLGRPPLLIVSTLLTQVICDEQIEFLLNNQAHASRAANIDQYAPVVTTAVNRINKLFLQNEYPAFR